MALTYTQHYTKFTCKILHLADFSTFTSNVICIFFPQVSAIPYLILDSVLMWHGKQAWHKYTVQITSTIGFNIWTKRYLMVDSKLLVIYSVTCQNQRGDRIRFPVDCLN